MKYDTILFDADGTLLDFEKSEREALIIACRAYGIELDDAMIKRYSKINDDLWKALEKGEVDKDTLRVLRFERFGKSEGFEVDFDALSFEYTDRLSEQNFLLDGAMEACEELSKICRLYIITNGIEYVQKNRFARSPINKYFKKLFISGEIGYEKPDIRFFDAVRNGIDDFDASRTLVVGDSLSSDMKGGIGAGLDCCYFTPSNKEIPDDFGIKYKVTSLSEIKAIVMREVLSV